MEVVPAEIWANVFEYLRLWDWIRVCHCCRRFRELGLAELVRWAFSFPFMDVPIAQSYVPSPTSVKLAFFRRSELGRMDPQQVDKALVELGMSLDDAREAIMKLDSLLFVDVLVYKVEYMSQVPKFSFTSEIRRIDLAFYAFYNRFKTFDRKKECIKQNFQCMNGQQCEFELSPQKSNSSNHYSLPLDCIAGYPFHDLMYEIIVFLTGNSFRIRGKLRRVYYGFVDCNTIRKRQDLVEKMKRAASSSKGNYHTIPLYEDLPWYNSLGSPELEGCLDNLAYRHNGGYKGHMVVQPLRVRLPIEMMGLPCEPRRVKKTVGNQVTEEVQDDCEFKFNNERIGGLTNWRHFVGLIWRLEYDVFSGEIFRSCNYEGKSESPAFFSFFSNRLSLLPDDQQCSNCV